MPDKPDDQIRKSSKQYEESLPGSSRNPHIQKDVGNLIARAAQPLPIKQEKQQPLDGYSDTQTHSHNTEDTLGSHSDTSHQ